MWGRIAKLAVRVHRRQRVNNGVGVHLTGGWSIMPVISVDLEPPAKVPAAHLDSYPILLSTTPTKDDKAKANREAMLALVSELRDNLNWSSGQGKAKYQTQHTISRGMLLARDRIATVLDEGSPFLELCTLAGFGWDDSTPS